MANVFNTFSFNKWADTKKEEEIDKESRKRRHQQIKRLKDKLRKERELREQGLAGGDGDVDLDALIEALQSRAIMADSNPFENWHNGKYVAGTGAGAGGMGGPGGNGMGGGPGGRGGPGEQYEDPDYAYGQGRPQLSDDYILEEIRRKNRGAVVPERRERISSGARSRTPSQRTSSATMMREESVTPQQERLRWQYNRKNQEMMMQQSQGYTYSEPASRSVSRVPSGRRSATRATSAERGRFAYNRHVTQGERYID